MDGLYFECTMDSPVEVALPAGAACVYSNRSPFKESANEDAAAVIPFENGAAVLVVADGLGGVAAGERASKTAVQAVCESIVAARGSGDLLRTAIIDGLERANADVQALAVGAATTLAILEWDGQSVRPYHVGDSTILVTGGRGKIKLETVAHSPVGYGVEAGLLEPEHAMHHEDRHIVSNVVGAADMRIDIGAPVQLSAYDTVVLASDGLCDNLRTSEICEIIRRGRLSKSAAQLAAAATARMHAADDGHPSKPDDLTFIVLRPMRTKRKSESTSPAESNVTGGG